jgi:HEAT repeat protein
MNSLAGHPNSRELKPRRKRKLWLVALAFLTGVFTFVSWPSNEPQFDAIPASGWFEEALKPRDGHLFHSPIYTNTFHAFMEMEGDAVPFLSKMATRKSSWSNVTYRKARELARRTLPWLIAKWLPETQDQNTPRLLAIIILGDIGNLQRTKAESGNPSAKPSITNALPAIRSALKGNDGNLSTSAAYSMGQIGPLAAEIIPDLIQVAKTATARDLNIYVGAIGKMGSLASNAVPLLLSILINTNHPALLREFAIMALGSIGTSAAPAALAIVPFLSHTNYSPVHNATWALASIGATPDEAVPFFEAMTKNPENPDTIAAVALWNRDRDTKRLCERLTNALNANRKDMVLDALGLLGTNAIPCALKVEELIDDPDPNISRSAKNVLRQIKLRTNRLVDDLTPLAP